MVVNSKARIDNWWRFRASRDAHPTLVLTRKLNRFTIFFLSPRPLLKYKPSHKSKVVAPTQPRLKQSKSYYYLHRVTDATTWMRSKHGLPCVEKVVKSSEGSKTE